MYNRRRMLRVAAWTVLVVCLTGYFLLWLIKVTAPPFPPDYPPVGDSARTLARTKIGAAIIRARLSEKLHGEALLECPNRIAQGTPQRVIIRIAEEILEEVLKELAPELTSRFDVPVSAIMRVSLTGDATFEIVQARPEKQTLAGRPYQEWRWDVTPRSFGKHKLYYQITADLGIDSETFSGEKTINVGFSLAYLFKQAIEVKASDTIQLFFVFLAGWLASLATQYWRSKRANRQLTTPASLEVPKHDPPHPPPSQE